jgi:hypothetical protein
VSGRVRRSSIVPDFNSPANIFIVIAGTKKRKTQGEITKSVSIFATPMSKTLKEPLKIHINILFTRRKTITTR